MNNCFNIENFDGQILENELMSKHTTYKIGGVARYYVKVNNTKSLKKLFIYCNENNIKWLIIGNGSNVLISDDGLDCLVISLEGDFKDIRYFENDNSYLVGAGVLLNKFANECIKNDCGGFEFAVGIPGSVGGAIKMNAGAYGHCISDRIDSVDLIDGFGYVTNKKANEIDWDYRYSSIGDDEIIIFAKFSVDLINDHTKEKSKSIIEENKQKRKSTQPLDYPNCGSVFKNPKNNSAAKLIDEAGLKGLAVGGAKVSEKHANFIINSDSANAKDVVELIQKIQKNVYNKSGIKLKPELKFLGFDDKCSLY